MPQRREEAQGKAPHAAAQHGFTLVETAIVLVVIGLLVGGIFVGRDLIAAARVRAQVGQVEKYNAAVHVFHQKYNALPGDMTPDLATAFGFAARAGTVGQGDGNGLIEGGQRNGLEPAGEQALFWADLTVAGLVDGSFQGTDCSYSTGSCTASTGGGGGSIPMSQIIPMGKLRDTSTILVFSNADGTNYFMLVGGSGQHIDSNGNWWGWSGAPDATTGFGATPSEAFAIDTKVDDGLPTTGVILSKFPGAVAGAAPVSAGHAGPASAGKCGNTDTTPTSYNANVAYGTQLACALLIRTSF